MRCIITHFTLLVVLGLACRLPVEFSRFLPVRAEPTRLQADTQSAPSASEPSASLTPFLPVANTLAAPTPESSLATVSSSPTGTATMTASPTGSSSLTVSYTPAASWTPSSIPARTSTDPGGPSLTPSPTSSQTRTLDLTWSAPGTSTSTLTASFTPSPSRTATPTASFSPPAPATPTRTATTATSNCPLMNYGYESAVISLVNGERSANGLAALSLNSMLSAGAETWSRYLATSGTWGHSSDPVWENIAAGYSSPAAVVAGWMNSPGHRANILNASLTQVGAGYAYCASSPYGHYWTLQLTP